MRAMVFFLMASLAWSAHLAARTVQVDYRVFSGLAHRDGSWPPRFAAGDGKVYPGLAYHGRDGRLVCHAAKRDHMRDPGALTPLSGEQVLGRGAKIHTKFGEGQDRRIYFGAHYRLGFQFARYARKYRYPGAHFTASDPAADRVDDFAAGTPYQGLVNGNYDSLFKRGHGITERHFAYYDSPQKGFFGRGYNKSKTAWRAVVWDADAKRFYGVDESASALFSFDPNSGESGEIHRLGQLSIPAFEDSREIPYATFSLTLGRGRKLCYAAAERAFDDSGSAGLAAVHLIPYDLCSGKLDDPGQRQLPGGRAAIGTNSAQEGRDGTIYFAGAIEVRPAPGEPVEAAG
jgi:hypothetical protein